MSNYSGTMSWSPPLPAAPLPALRGADFADADVGRLIRRRRIGIACFWVLTFLAINNLNGLAVMALGREQFFSYLMLLCVIVGLIVFQFALVRDMGASGLLFILFLATYFAISLPINFHHATVDI